MKAAIAALGTDPDRLELLIMQFVNIVEGGEQKQMSKRKGEFITLDDLVAEVGVDATRWFMLEPLARHGGRPRPRPREAASRARTPSTTSSTRTPGSPRSWRRRGRSASTRRSPPWAGRRTCRSSPRSGRSSRSSSRSRRRCSTPPTKRAPHRITVYALELAQTFTAFYRDCQVVGAEGEGVEDLRLALCVASRRTIATALGLLGVTAPDAM